MEQSRIDAIDAKMDDGCRRLQRLIGATGDVPWAEFERALRDLLEAYADHVDESEAPDGLLLDLTETDPRLEVDVAELRREHTELAERFCALLATEPERSVLEAEAAEILGRIDAHRRRGTQLMYRAWTEEEGGRG